MIELIVGLFFHNLAVVGGFMRGLQFCGEQLREEVSVGWHGRLKQL